MMKSMREVIEGMRVANPDAVDSFLNRQSSDVLKVLIVGAKQAAGAVFEERWKDTARMMKFKSPLSTAALGEDSIKIVLTGLAGDDIEDAILRIRGATFEELHTWDTLIAAIRFGSERQLYRRRDVLAFAGVEPGSG